MGYRQPGRFNVVTLSLALLLCAGVYSAVQFGPPYLRKWKVREVADAAVNKAASRHFRSDEKLDALRKTTAEEVRRVGIEDIEMRVSIERRGRQATVTIEYDEVVKHPLVGKTTTLHFSPTANRTF